MRIVHVANFYGPRSGGIRTAMHALAGQYLEHGHDPVLVVPGERPGVSVVDGVRVVTMAAPRVPLSGGYRAVVRTGQARRLLDALRPDRLEVSDRTTLVSTGDWARESGVPSVLLLHERVDGVLRAFLPGGGPDGRIREVGARTMPMVADRYNALALPLFDRLVATTGYAAAEVERLRQRPFARGLRIPPLHRVPLGVDLDLFRPDRNTPEAREQLAPRDAALVVVASRLSKEKRVDLAVDAAAQVLHDGRPLRLVVAGAGPLLPALRERAERAGLPHRFLSFVPDRERLATLLACADVVVAPGPIETFGLAALEALASGTPVVCSSTSALPEVVGDAGAAGAPEPAALALAIHEVLAREVTARRAAARARAELFPWSATGDAMLALHRRAFFEHPEVLPDSGARTVLAGSLG
ncbi:glycosyltransferase [Antribacter sp. KLBMP9083]|uniref:Glycosyltransferase n=1 Tax=Antribacter soli TaxID=2910976 RepID=A0AA41U970_9MICO|nr:glycosyltransferase [Antribacter soli]MCF4123210.1 glycosyltransferase [Antribacter soli]